MRCGPNEFELLLYEDEVRRPRPDMKSKNDSVVVVVVVERVVIISVFVELRIIFCSFVCKIYNILSLEFRPIKLSSLER